MCLENQAYDIVVVGGGMVGASAVLGFVRAGFRVALIDARALSAVLPGGRVSAITPQSERFLRRLHAWPDNVSYFRKMQVWEANSAIDFSAGEIGVAHLGAIVENQRLCKQIYACLKPYLHDAGSVTSDHISESCGQVDCFAPAKLTQIVAAANAITVSLDNGKQLNAKLLVGADGACSTVRDLGQFTWQSVPYDHHALTATLATEKPHDQTAWQRFAGDRIIAFLPLGDPHRCSLVYSAPKERVSALAEMVPEAFNRALEKDFGSILGGLEVQGGCFTFPLVQRRVMRYYQHRIVLAGDAAHTIHPLAGQGANLGLMDVQALVTTISNAQVKQRDIGLPDTLARYQRERVGANLAMQRLMDAFKIGFGTKNPLITSLRQLGLRLASQQQTLKRYMIRQMSL